MPSDFNSQINAYSKLVRDEQGRLAFVRVRLSHNGSWSMLIPHELEHIVEQLDGVNLAASAAQQDGRTWRVGGETYETRRAHDAGRLVHQEYRKRAPTERLALNGTTVAPQP
jgi:hypothetical protein